MKRDYELILMLDPQVADDQRTKLAEGAKSRLEAKGTLNHESRWGLRKMAYEIDKRGEADYRYFRFSGESDLLDDLNHNLRITDGVLRFRIFKVDPESPIIEPPDTEQIMRRDEEDDRGRGRGRRDDRGPRRPRDDEAPAPAAAPAAAATEAAPEAPAVAETPATPETPAAPEAPAAPEPAAAEEPAEPAPAAAEESADADSDSDA